MIVIAKKDVNFPKYQDETSAAVFFERGKHYKAEKIFNTKIDKTIYRIKSIGTRYLSMEEDLFITYFRIFTG